MFEIGNTLREARLRRGLDVTECELGTKIRAKYLRAMEEEHFDLLPSPAYVRGFLRTYAEYLGLDGQLVIDEYESRFAHRDPGESEHRRPRAASRTRPQSSSAIRPNRRRTETQLLWLAIGGVMSVALLVWMGVGNPSQSTTPIQGTTPAAAVTPEPNPELDTSEAPEPVRIRLSGLGPAGSYVIVRRGGEGGPQVFAGILADGEIREYRVAQPLWVRTYNASGLRVAVMNRPPRTMSGGTADLLITRSGVREATTGATTP